MIKRVDFMTIVIETKTIMTSQVIRRITTVIIK